MSYLALNLLQLLSLSACVGFLLINTELHGSTTWVKSFKMSYLALNLFKLTLKRYNIIHLSAFENQTCDLVIQTSILESVSLKHPWQNQLPPGSHEASAHTQEPMKTVDLHCFKPLISLVPFNLHFHCFQGQGHCYVTIAIVFPANQNNLSNRVRDCPMKMQKFILVLNFG